MLLENRYAQYSVASSFQWMSWIYRFQEKKSYKTGTFLLKVSEKSA